MLSPTITKIGPCGGDYCIDRDMDLNGVTRIVKIGLRHGDAIDAIEVCFERDGCEESTGLWGGTGGGITWIPLEPNEYITSITGHHFRMWHYYKIIRTLTFKTNLRTIGCFGKEQGTPFEYSAPPGGQIIGFFGQSSKKVLVALGAYVKMPSSSVRLPGLLKVGPWGGTVKDMDLTGVTRISKICIRHRDSIETFIVCYERNGLEEKTKAWGGEKEHQDISWIRLRPTEYITAISGHIDMIPDRYELEFCALRSLKFKTFNPETKSSETYGPYGEEKGVFFELSALGGEIIGFYGRGESLFSAIGVYVKASTSVSCNLRSSDIYKVGPCGSSSGDERDMNLHGITNILRMDIRHDRNVIHAFSVYFKRFGCEESTNTWGGGGGQLEEITLDSTEHITNISGHLGEVGNIYAVRSLKLKTSHQTYGPYGKEEGIPFDLPALGGQIVGFHARSTTLLLAIGAYIKIGDAKPSWRTEGDNRFWGRPVCYVGNEGCKYNG